MSNLQAQKKNIIYTTKDSILTETLLHQFPHNNAIEQQIIQLGLSFIKTPYVANTLEKEGKEQLVVNMREMDCTTFVETVMALTLAAQKESPSFKDFCIELQKIRYRNGCINEYPSRLHYFSDWIQNNIQKGVIKDVTPIEGSITAKFPINYMSSHADKYSALTNNLFYLKEIQSIEKELSQTTIRYIPKDSLSIDNIGQIHNGDIIAITTSIKGLDISHVGLAYWKNNELHLLHASLNKKQITIENSPLNKQLQQYKTQSGIRVLRIISKKGR